MGARLRGLRASRGLSQEQLARELGVSFATVNRWETGRTQMSARAREALSEFEAAKEAPAVARETPPTVPPPRLPVAQSSFVGRDRELAELIPLLRDSRLVTLTGPGGAGKTRLAAEALTRWAPAIPVVFIPLEAVFLASPRANRFVESVFTAPVERRDWLTAKILVVVTIAAAYYVALFPMVLVYTHHVGVPLLLQ